MKSRICFGGVCIRYSVNRIKNFSLFPVVFTPSCLHNKVNYEVDLEWHYKHCHLHGNVLLHNKNSRHHKTKEVLFIFNSTIIQTHKWLIQDLFTRVTSFNSCAMFSLFTLVLRKKYTAETDCQLHNIYRNFQDCEIPEELFSFCVEKVKGEVHVYFHCLPIMLSDSVSLILDYLVKLYTNEDFLINVTEYCDSHIHKKMLTKCHKNFKYKTN